MSDTSTGDPGKPMEQVNNDLSDAFKHPSVTTDNSDENSTPPKNLSDMPIHVVGLIIERSEYKEQLLLRTVSKSLQALVDKQKPACESIQVHCSKESITITFSDDYEVVYSDDEDYDVIPRTKGLKDFEKFAFDHLASTLKNPKLELEDFLIFDYFLENEENEKYCNELQRMLGSLNHQVSVKKFDITLRSSSWLLSTLSHFKPGVLETISLHTFRGDHWKAGMDQVALLEQWKQAKEIKTNFSFGNLPIEYATNFKRFDVFEPVIDINMFDRMKNYFSKLDNFEYCHIRHVSRNNDIEDVQRMIGTPVPPNMSHYSIPDSDYCLEFSIDLYDITIVKKICHLH